MWYRLLWALEIKWELYQLPLTKSNRKLKSSDSLQNWPLRSPCDLLWNQVHKLCCRTGECFWWYQSVCQQLERRCLAEFRFCSIEIFCIGKAWIDPRKNLFLTIQRVSLHTGSVLNMFSLTKQFCPAWMMKLCLDFQCMGRQLRFWSSSFIADFDSIWQDNFVDKQRGSFNDYCVRCLVNSLDNCCLPRTHGLDCAIVWGSVKAQLECNSGQQKPFTIQKFYMWCSIQLEIKLFALSELVQLFLFHFLVCLVVRSVLIILPRGPRKFTSKVCVQFGFNEC